MTLRAVRQLPLEFAERPHYGAEAFLVSDSNQIAYDWIQRWPGGWTAHGAIIQGPEGSGKTHLLHLWAKQADAHWIGLAEFRKLDPVETARQYRHLALDDLACYLVDGADERRLLHLLNAVKEEGGTLLLSAHQPPAALDIRLPDLSSRLRMLPVVRLGPPDDILLAAVFVKLLQDRQLTVEPKVAAYVAARTDRSFAALRRTVAQLDRLSLQRKQPITLAVARAVLEIDETSRAA